MESTGIAAIRLKSVYSVRCWPLKVALTWLPVRIRPGHTVVTRTPSLASCAQSLREPDLRELAGVVGQQVGRADLTADGSDIDDAPGSPLPHLRQDGQRRVDRSPEVDLHRRFIILQ